MPSLVEKRARLEEELALALEGRANANPGTQAFASMCRLVRQAQADLDALEAEENPLRGMTPTEILDRTAEYAKGLPEPVLAVFADEWARRHRTRWIPVDE